MKLLLSGAAAFGMLGSAAFVALDAGDSGTSAKESAVLATLDRAPPSRFELTVAGREATCAVSKGEAVSPTLAKLSIGEGCAALMPALDRARYWHEAPNGAVAFAERDGGAVIEFAAADGVAYETFRPGSPLASLIAAD